MPHFVLTTAPQLEFIAQRAIETMGIEALVPDEHHPLRVKYSKSKGVVPEQRWRRVQIMRGYVVVDVDSIHDLYAIKHAVNMHRRIIGNPLGADFTPKPVPTIIINHLKSISGKRLGPKYEVVKLKTGDVAKVVRGPMAGHTVTITSKAGATLWHEFLGSVREIKIPIAYCEAA